MSEEYLNQGLSVLLPQGFWKKEYLNPYIKLAEQKGVEIFVYQLEAPQNVLLERISKRPKPELAQTPVPQERIVKNLQTWEDNRYQIGKVFNTSELKSEEIVNLILEDISH